MVYVMLEQVLNVNFNTFSIIPILEAVLAFVFIEFVDNHTCGPVKVSLRFNFASEPTYDFLTTQDPDSLLVPNQSLVKLRL
jgi:hypothetical protein